MYRSDFAIEAKYHHMHPITAKFKLSAKALTIAKMICIQILVAAVSGLMPFVIAEEFGSKYLADILYQYSLFVLAYSVASFGIPEQIQVMRGGGGGRYWLIRVIFFATIAVGFSSLLLALPSMGGTAAILLFCMNYLLVESSSRIANQEGGSCWGRLYCRAYPLAFG